MEKKAKSSSRLSSIPTKKIALLQVLAGLACLAGKFQSSNLLSGHVCVWMVSFSQLGQQL